MALPFSPEVRGMLRRKRGVNVGLRMLRTPGISTHQSGFCDTAPDAPYAVSLDYPRDAFADRCPYPKEVCLLCLPIQPGRLGQKPKRCGPLYIICPLCLHRSFLVHFRSFFLIMSFITQAVNISLAVLTLWLLKKVTEKKPLGKPIPGPKGWPIIGNLLDVPTEVEYKVFSHWKQKYGESIRTPPRD